MPASKPNVSGIPIAWLLRHQCTQNMKHVVRPRLREFQPIVCQPVLIWVETPKAAVKDSPYYVFVCAPKPILTIPFEDTPKALSTMGALLRAWFYLSGVPFVGGEGAIDTKASATFSIAYHIELLALQRFDLPTDSQCHIPSKLWAWHHGSQFLGNMYPSGVWARKALCRALSLRPPAQNKMFLDAVASTEQSIHAQQKFISLNCMKM